MQKHFITLNNSGVSEHLQLLENKLSQYLNQHPQQTGELLEAAAYMVELPGHRWRPILLFAIYEALGGKNVNDCLPIACSVEYLHTASIIIDDLPAMDDGKLRRGKKPCHLEFSQARAILTAHWLCDVAQFLLHGFQLRNITNLSVDVENYFRATKNEMMRGQILDLERKDLSHEEIIEMCRLKSGALYSFTASLPAYVLGATKAAKSLENFGNYLGIAYQISDDIHDCTNTVEELGKDVSKDEDKKTIPRVSGLSTAVELRDFYKRKAISEVKSIFDPIDQISNLVESICA